MRGARTGSGGMDRTSAWFGTLSGIAGFGLLLTVETSAGPSAMTPVLRYSPPAPAGPLAKAASPGIAFAVRPTVDRLRSAFSDAGYELDGVRLRGESVPRLNLVSLPRDLPEIRDVATRKIVFLKLALPLVLEANRHVAGQRKRLEQVAARMKAGTPLPPDLQRWLSEIAAEYRVDAGRIDILLRRVDTVPPSLALAQAAAESGWGTSRFALEGNAIFGQWTSAGGKGLVPLERPAGRTYKVRAFDRLIDSFEAYLLNLNTHPAYADFRKQREQMRRAGRAFDGLDLAATLGSYSERGQDYIDLLQSIIRVNALSPLDDAKLGAAEIVLASGA